MSGAWGIGPLDEAAAGLARAGFWVLAVAGSNAKLAGRLQAVAASGATSASPSASPTACPS